MTSAITRAALFVFACSLLLCACENTRIVATMNTDTSTHPEDSSDSNSLPDTTENADTNTDTETDTGPDTDTGTEPMDDTAVPDCSAATAVAGDSTRSVMVNGIQRSYVLHIPGTYSGDAAVPLILDFHPIGDSAAGEQSNSPYPAVTDGEGVIMAFPDGLAGPLGAAWNIGPCCVDNANDVAFARAVVDDVSRIACINTNRIYAVGTSMGGGMVHHLGCEAADLFAAVAPAAFDLIEETVDACAPARPLTVVTFRGTADPLVPYGGGYSDIVPNHPITFLGAVNTFEKWAALNQCSGAAQSFDADCLRYPGEQCAMGVEVILCTEENGGIQHGNAALAWPILKQYSLP
ncbi:MAG: hypothetical protein JXX29_06120 [Deltaproteobacteria bacterium]|nr:hypothetical protein [Deltaproteobacteria bacterium]MBN2671226.1 hypothetical protein [Deltaproteobacteria bacterium]